VAESERASAQLIHHGVSAEALAKEGGSEDIPILIGISRALPA
jgi:hypothetical protein